MIFSRFASHRSVLLSLLALASCSFVRADPARLIIENGLLFPMSSAEKTPFVGYIVVGQDGKIQEIGHGAIPTGLKADAVVDASGKFVSPGFISSHSHIWQSANRAFGASSPLLQWIGDFSPYTEGATPEDLYWYTLHGCLDFIKYGITSAYNFTFDGSHFTGYEGPTVEPIPGPWEQEQFKAMADSGMRFVHSFCIPYFDTPEKNHQKVVDFVAFTKTYADHPTFLKLSVQGNVAFVLPKDAKAWAQVEWSYMKEFGLDNQMHMFEPAGEAGIKQREKYRAMVEVGMVGPQLFWGHFIHTTPEIIAECAKLGSNMSWQPLSNGRLGSGIADIPAILKAGMKVGMGVDDQAASDIPDPFENMRTGLYAIRDKYENAHIMEPYDVLRFHTIGSATVMGVADKVGSLEKGKFGDILIINPRDRDVGPVNDPYGTLVLACGQANLEQVYIGGKLVSQRGKILSQDFDKVAAEVHRRADAVKARVDAKKS